MTVTAYNRVAAENASLTVTVQDMIHCQFSVAALLLLSVLLVDMTHCKVIKILFSYVVYI